jgi:hypothetical protein
MLLANEALFFSGRNQFTVDEERCRRVVAQRTGEAENNEGLTRIGGLYGV